MSYNPATERGVVQGITEYEELYSGDQNCNNHLSHLSDSLCHYPGYSPRVGHLSAGITPILPGNNPPNPGINRPKTPINRLKARYPGFSPLGCKKAAIYLEGHFLLKMVKPSQPWGYTGGISPLLPLSARFTPF